MKTLFPTPTTVNQARRQANILARAETLLTTGGYVAVQFSRRTLFGMYKPGNVRPARGVWHSDYTVDMTPGYEICSCKGFREDGDCKHRLAVALQMEEEAALLAQFAQEEAREFTRVMYGW